MPDLRPHPAAGGMHRVDHPLPAGERGSAVEERDARVIAGRRAVDHRALRQDQTHLALGATPVVGGDVLARHALRRERTRHRRHDDAVLQLERLQPKGLEQGIGVW